MGMSRWDDARPHPPGETGGSIGPRLTDQELRDAFADAEGACDSADLLALQRALDGEATPAELRALIDRLGQDRELAAAWRLGAALRRELRPGEVGHRRRSRRLQLRGVLADR